MKHLTFKPIIFLFTLLVISVSSNLQAQTNYALDFDGTDDYVSASSLSYTDNLTMEAWVNWDGQSGSPGIMYNGNSSSSGYGIMLNSGATPSQSITILCGGVAYVASSTELPTDEWHHIAAVRDNGTWKLYFDGVEKSLSNSTASPSSPSGSFTIGSVTAGTDPFNGKIDEVRFWSSARSQYDIITTIQLHLDGSETNLVANWRLNDGTGGTTTDLVGSYNGTLNNMTDNDWVTSTISFQAIATRTNKALDFDGVNDYISTGYLPLANNSFTIEFWARQDVASLGRYRIIVSQGTGAENQGLHIGFRDNNKFTFAFYGNDLDVTTATTDTEWHHWACSYDTSGNFRKIYQDGKLVASDNPASDFTGGDKLQIGYNAFSGNNFWDGQIDEVRVWGDERTHAEILSTMNLYLDGSENNLLANWKLDDGSGFTADDLKNSYDGYLFEMTYEDWVISTTPFGSGVNYTQNGFSTGSWITFGSTDTRINFNTIPANEIVSVTKINGLPNVVPTDLDDVFDSQYWIVNRSSSDPITGDAELSVSEDIVDADNTDMRRIRLYDRTVNFDGAWSFVKTADWIDATQDYATFNNLVTFQQFIYGRKTTPMVSSLSPTDNATDVAPDANLVITFDQNVVSGSGNIYIKKYSDDSTIETIAASACSFSGAQVTINPTTSLAMETEYYVIIDNNAFKNNNTFFSGYSDKNDWNFTTKENLQISSVNPEDNSTNISITTNLTITFSRDVSAESGNIYIKKYSDDSTVETIAASACSISGAEVIINPINNLLIETECYVIIENTAFKDEYDSYFYGWYWKDNWNFATVNEFQASFLNPADNSSCNLLDINIVLNFNRNVFAGTGNIFLKKYDDDSIVETFSASPCTISGTKVTINPSSNLEQDTHYFLIIENTAFKDESESYFAGYLFKDNWDFTISKFQASSLYPADNSTSNITDFNFVLNFNKNVLAGAGNIFLKKYDTDSIVETFSASVCTLSDTKVTITPSNNLELETQYYLIIENTAFKDEYDNYFAGYSLKEDWNFSIVYDSTCENYLNVKLSNGTYNNSSLCGLSEIVFNTDASGITITKTDGSIYSYDIASLVELTIDDTQQGEPLPVELISFTSEIYNNKVKLSWRTATEINNYGFGIQKSVVNNQISDKKWETIGFVEGHGNSNSPKTYSFIDTLANSTVAERSRSYRLKQMDTDGTYKYSETVEISFDEEIPKEYALAQNYPNPFNPSTVIKYSIPTDELVTLKIYDMLGREVTTLVNEKRFAGNHKVAFNINSLYLASGVYVYKLVSGKYISSKKMLVLK